MRSGILTTFGHVTDVKGTTAPVVELNRPRDRLKSTRCGRCSVVAFMSAHRRQRDARGERAGVLLRPEAIRGLRALARAKPTYRLRTAEVASIPALQSSRRDGSPDHDQPLQRGLLKESDSGLRAARRLPAGPANYCAPSAKPRSGRNDLAHERRRRRAQRHRHAGLSRAVAQAGSTLRSMRRHAPGTNLQRQTTAASVGQTQRLADYVGGPISQSLD